MIAKTYNAYNVYNNINGLSDNEFIKTFYNMYIKKVEKLINGHYNENQIFEEVQKLLQINNIMINSIKFNIENEEELFRLFNFLSINLLQYNIQKHNRFLLKILNLLHKIKGVQDGNIQSSFEN